jgi:hypothetical protein
VFFGIINGFLVKKRLKTDPAYNPIGWWKAESVFVLAIFGVTAFMVQQEPPLNAAQSHKAEANLSLFLAINGTSVLLFACALLFATMLVLAYHKKMPPYISVVMGILFAVTGYLSFMAAVR